jgi:N-acetylglutamate synthase-like GNAT family acetyltransferase
MMQVTIRRARRSDVDAISQVIVDTLRDANAKDYAPAVIERVAANFAPERVAQMLTRRIIVVASVSDVIVGTGGLEGSSVRSVFVRPNCQSQGIGSAIMIHIEALARELGVGQLTLSSSVTAEAFYAKRGYVAVRDGWYGDERTIVMEKNLIAT